ncbi:dipeptide ABC transporter ATP-binding protein [Lacibacterium aquatile]|uniref:Dipeptide ABC transporter ATP-binding protein n=1 Tax=Lacibacterium aquatile TaxID=1168082 RepID=A0ABW5DQD4_9PROT
MNVLSIKDLEVEFRLASGGLKAVKGASFDIPAGSTVALVGESGSGKSVLAQAIMGILPASAKVTGGQILFRDPAQEGSEIDLATLSDNGPEMRTIRGGRIAIVFQEPMTALSPLHTIGDQISEALHLHRDVDVARGRELVIEMLRLAGFKDPDRAYRAYTFELSGGLRQRAMIAMALVCRPALLIADEPTTALDVTIQAQILKLMRDLQADLQMAMLLITHDLGVVANVAERVVVMYHGKIVESGSVADVFKNPQHPYLKALLRAVPDLDRAEGERLQPIRDYPRADSKQLFGAGAVCDHAAGAPLLIVENITKSFKQRGTGLFGQGGGGLVKAVDDVSLIVRRGECLGLVGESGCGKTTLSKMIMRAIRPDSGRITFADPKGDIDVLALEGDDLKSFRRRLQFMFQDPFSSLDPRMTVGQVIAEPLSIHNIGTSDERRAKVEKLMQLVGLDPRAINRYPHSFSGGQRQRIGIARALALRPDMLICDEPVSALDVSIQAQILNLLKDLREELGLTYLFISHNLAVIDYVADRVAVMCAGHLVEVADRASLFASPQHPYTQALLSAVPVADLDRPLDFTRIMEGKASNPTAWPEAFRIDQNHTPSLIEVQPGHLVRSAA